MKKITILALVLFAASASFAQTANPSKVKNASQSVQIEGSKQKADEIKKSNASNPIGKNNNNSGSTETTGKTGSTTKPAPYKSIQVKTTIKNTDKSSGTGK